MHVHAVGVERDGRALDVAVVDRHQQEIDVRLLLHGVVGQAAAEDGGEDGAVLLDLGNERIERVGELLMDRGRIHGPGVGLRRQCSEV